STRVPLVKRRVEDFWKREVRAHISPDEVVAIGAAIQASALSGAEQRRKGTVPPAPSPARASMPSSTDQSAIAKRRSAVPGAQRPRSDTTPGPALQSGQARGRMPTSPDGFGIPSTVPFQGGRARMPTTPGVQEGADPMAPTRHPALGVLGRPSQPAGAEQERPKQKTGTGLGPAAPRAIAGPTLVSAADSARAARIAAEASLPLVMPEPPPLANATTTED